MITLIVPEFGEYGVFTKTDDGWAGPLGMDQMVDFTQCLEVIAERDATIERKDNRIAELEAGNRPVYKHPDCMGLNG